MNGCCQATCISSSIDGFSLYSCLAIVDLHVVVVSTCCFTVIEVTRKMSRLLLFRLLVMLRLIQRQTHQKLMMQLM